VGQHCQAAALRIGKLHSASLEFCFQDAVFLTQVGNDMILVSVDAGGQPGDQELEDHGLTLGLKIPTLWLNSVYAQQFPPLTL